MTSEETIRSKLSSSDAPAIDSHQTESVREDDGTNLQELITGCQHGNPAMQRELYDLSHHQLFRLAVRMVGRQDASDVCQQIYLKAFEAIKQFAGRSSLMTWLYRIAVNECLQFRRKRGSRPMLQLTDYEPPDRNRQAFERAQQRELLENALDRIDPELRCIFLLREKDELSYAQIAEVMQLAEGTVASRLSRARERLQEILAASAL